MSKSKPSYPSTYIDTGSITEAEREWDRRKSEYDEQMREWWKSLTPKERKIHKKDKPLFI